MVKFKTGLCLYKKKMPVFMPKTLTVTKIRFTPEELRDKLLELVNNPMYVANMLKL